MSPRADAWFIQSGKKSQALLESCDSGMRPRKQIVGAICARILTLCVYDTGCVARNCAYWTHGQANGVHAAQERRSPGSPGTLCRHQMCIVNDSLNQLRNEDTYGTMCLLPM
jgi:hypothetical protein